MGDTIDGSSAAAQGAHAENATDGTEEEPPGQTGRGGLLSRIIAALSPADPGAEPPGAGRDANGTARPGLPGSDLPGMVNLHRMRLEEVMTPSAEIVAAPRDISREDLVALFRESGLSRLPVYDGTLDTPVGLVHLKDLALTHGFENPGEDAARFDLEQLLRPLLFAPPSMPIGVLLQKMQAGRIHMALVIDEYGGVDGLVTLEDLVEQVVGEIEDEHDAEEGPLWRLEAPGRYIAEARAPLDEFEAETGIGLRGMVAEDDEVDTLGGLVFLLAGRVPVRGEVIEHPSGVEFEVTEADARRVKRLRIRLPDHARG